MVVSSRSVRAVARGKSFKALLEQESRLFFLPEVTLDHTLFVRKVNRRIDHVAHIHRCFTHRPIHLPQQLGRGAIESMWVAGCWPAPPSVVRGSGI
jgi:hypothetical protein